MIKSILNIGTCCYWMIQTKVGGCCVIIFRKTRMLSDLTWMLSVTLKTHKLGLAWHYSSSTVLLWYLRCQTHSFLMRHNSSPYARIKKVAIFFVHKSFTLMCIEGFTLRRVAFLHEMDITVSRGSSLYPWETENPLIGWARKPDWRKWIIGNRSVPAVIMLQRRCRTPPQRCDGMGAGCFF